MCQFRRDPLHRVKSYFEMVFRTRWCWAKLWLSAEAFIGLIVDVNALVLLDGSPSRRAMRVSVLLNRSAAMRLTPYTGAGILTFDRGRRRFCCLEHDKSGWFGYDKVKSAFSRNSVREKYVKMEPRLSILTYKRLIHGDLSYQPALVSGEL